MTDENKKRWNDRYRMDEYAYGTLPNQFLETQLSKYKPGKALFAAEGEGRNAVFAATLGWQVCAFDISDEAKKKAEKLAKEKNVVIDYAVGELDD